MPQLPDPDPDPDPGSGARWETLFRDALLAEGVPAHAEATLTFISLDEMTALNEAHMGASGPTDVLSFPIDGLHFKDLHRDLDGSAPAADRTDAPPVMVGDVVVCVEIAERAVTPDRSLEDEIALLVVHGALHLLGHDHYEPEERERMQERERVLLQRFYR